ncbi:hypothetical protein H5P28_06500 [Ruficoccus amylovorans]|uniref:Protein SirB1 N-terminal domain-containing protein n=1 Tax=Ruficoccus amylovorans TaxID=1804625 RepID=A0A842HCW2_9BACT|nr:transglutaminase-like domain-containing protein [Ruficoccus amylovorans]MBC2593908.1 hypothetical protein [Ruficoccus amylovorans]
MNPHATPERKAALLALLDDPSKAVRTAVLEAYRELGETGVSWLREAVRADGDRADDARRVLHELREDDPKAAFIEFIHSYRYELETGALMLNRTWYPDLDLAECCLFLDAIADRCEQLFCEPSTDFEKCRVLNRVIFHEYGFSGDQEDFYHPDNSFLNRVLERRRGLPITLSIVYLLVAYRCGLPLEPVGFPGRFMVGCYTEGEPFFIDVFESGVFRTAEELEAMLESHRLESDPGILAPISVGEVLVRCCRNLVNQFTRARDPESARLYADFVHEFENAYKRKA